MRRLVIILCITVLGFYTLALPTNARAGSSSLQIIFEDTLWGMGIGALVGAASLAFVNEPSDHMDRIAQGASIGIIGGICFGFYEVSPLFYSMKDPRTGERTYVMGLNFRLK